jgi:hypothetical protein
MACVPAVNHRSATIKRIILITAILGVVIAILVTVRRQPEPEPGPLLPTARDDATVSPAPVTIVTASPSWTTIDNPETDGWETEAFSRRARTQLDRLGELLVRPRPPGPDDLAPLIAEEFTAAIAAPTLVVYDSDDIVVRRSQPGEDTEEIHGANALAAWIHAAAVTTATDNAARVKFKVFRVARTAGTATTHQYVERFYRTDSHIVEQHATWVTDWVETAGDPKLRSIVVTRLEEIVTSRTSGRLFSDCTRAVLGHNSCFESQLMKGVNYWLERLPERAPRTADGIPGLALGDVNGDGLDDLYLCQRAGLPNRLFLQNPDGTLDDVSAAWGVDWLEDSRSALLLDLDNDGDQDLAVAIFGHIVVAANEDNRHFKVRTVVRTAEDLNAVSAVDYDLDGYLDIFAGAYGPDQFLTGAAAPSFAGVGSGFVYVDAGDGGRNSLLHNETKDTPSTGSGQGWQFTDVTAQVGLNEDNSRYSYAASWEDFDNDGDQDLYIANDYGANKLYRNDAATNGRKFVDVAAELGANDPGSGMSVSWGDYDRDGWMDIYVGNMFSAAGNRVTRQDRFKPDANDATKERFQYFARGNTLLRNIGGSRFEDVSVAAGVTMGRWAWSSNFVDINNDSWQDLIVTNGFLTTPDSRDL